MMGKNKCLNKNTLKKASEIPKISSLLFLSGEPLFLPKRILFFNIYTYIYTFVRIGKYLLVP